MSVYVCWLKSIIHTYDSTMIHKLFVPYISPINIFGFVAHGPGLRPLRHRRQWWDRFEGVEGRWKNGEIHGDFRKLGRSKVERLWLVGGLEHDWIMTFHILGMSSSQLTNIFQRARYTTNQIIMANSWDSCKLVLSLLLVVSVMKIWDSCKLVLSLLLVVNVLKIRR